MEAAVAVNVRTADLLLHRKMKPSPSGSPGSRKNALVPVTYASPETSGITAG
jgi:hypothetical protein